MQRRALKFGPPRGRCPLHLLFLWRLHEMCATVIYSAKGSTYILNLKSGALLIKGLLMGHQIGQPCRVMYSAEKNQRDHPSRAARDAYIQEEQRQRQTG